MTAAAIRLDPDTCILEGKACNASDNGGPSLEEKLKNEREIDEQHKAKEEADAAKAGAGSESEEPSKGKPVELRDQLENGDTKVTEEIRANDVAKKEEAAAAVTEAKVAAEQSADAAVVEAKAKAPEPKFEKDGEASLAKIKKVTPKEMKAPAVESSEGTMIAPFDLMEAVTHDAFEQKQPTQWAFPKPQ